MSNWQQLVVFLWIIYSVSAFFIGFSRIRQGNTHGSSAVFALTGAFVWADAVIFGLFWTAASAFSFILKDWILFLLFFSVFWTVRAWGEAVYFFNQQFSQKTLVKPENMRNTYRLFKNDSVWFVRQIEWQCVMVLGVISTIYLAKIWF